MSAINPISDLSRPTIVRDRERILRALAHSLLAADIETLNHPDGTLRELATMFARNLDAFGVELRLRRTVRS